MVESRLKVLVLDDTDRLNVGLYTHTHTPKCKNTQHYTQSTLLESDGVKVGQQQQHSRRQQSTRSLVAQPASNFHDALFCTHNANDKKRKTNLKKERAFKKRKSNSISFSYSKGFDDRILDSRIVTTHG